MWMRGEHRWTRYNSVLFSKILGCVSDLCSLQLGFAWGVFMLFHANFSIMIHTTSIWLTLSLAVWR